MKSDTSPSKRWLDCKAIKITFFYELERNAIDQRKTNDHLLFIHFKAIQSLYWNEATVSFTDLDQDSKIIIFQSFLTTFRHLLSLVVPFKLLGKFGNFWILHLAVKVPHRARDPVNAPGRVRVISYVRLGKVRLS